MECKNKIHINIAITQKKVTENPTRQLYYIIILNNSTRAMEIFFFFTVSQNYYRHRSIFVYLEEYIRKRVRETDMKLLLVQSQKIAIVVVSFHVSQF